MPENSLGTHNHKLPLKSVSQRIAESPAHSLSIKFFQSLEPLEEVWRRLESETINYAFQSYDWIACWQQQVGANEMVDPCPVLIESDAGMPLMILPLGIRRKGRTSSLIWLGGKLADYQTALFSDAIFKLLDTASFEVLWTLICKELPKFDYILLEKQPALIANFSNPFILPGSTPHSCDAHSANLQGSPEAFISKRRSKKWLKKERRNERRLEEAGQFRFIKVNTKSDARELLPTMMQQKSRSYTEMGVPDLFANDSYRNFVVSLTEHSLDLNNDFVCLFGFYAGERLLATAWGVISGERYYYLLPSYAKDNLSRYSPGNVLLRYMFHWCFENDITTFDFTAGDESYKLAWCENKLMLHDFISGVTFSGHLVAIREKIVRSLKRYIKNNQTIFTIIKRARMNR